MWYLETVLIAVAWMLAILSALLGLDRMIRIIMWNYLINSILLWMSNFLEMMSQRLIYLQDTVSIHRRENRSQRLWQFLLDGKPTLLLTTYIILILFIIKRAHIWIWRIENEGVRWILTVLFIPSTVLSIFLSIGTAFFWHKIMDLDAIEWIASTVQHNDRLYNIVLLTPLRIVLPGLFVIIVAAFVLHQTDEIVEKKVIVSERIYEQDPLLEPLEIEHHW